MAKAKATAEKPEVKAANVPPPSPSNALPAGIKNQTSSEDVPQKSGPPAFKARAAQLKELADDNREDRDQKLREEGLEPTDTSGDVDHEAGPDPENDENLNTDHAAEAAAEPTAIPATIQPASTSTKRKFIVDGQEVELSDEQITAYVQKGAFADKTVKDATHLLNQARQAADEVRRAVASGTPSLPAASSPAGATGDHPPANSGADAAAIAKALLYGNEEEATQAISRVLGQGRQASASTAQNLSTQTQGMTPDQVQSHVQQAMAWESAKTKFDLPPDQGGYKDLWSDPFLKDAFIAREDKLRNSGDKRTYAEVHQEIATELRRERDRLVNTYAPKTGLEGRDEAKRAAGVVRGAGGKPPAPSTESRPKSHEEKLDGIRAARGQK